MFKRLPDPTVQLNQDLVYDSRQYKLQCYYKYHQVKEIMFSLFFALFDKFHFFHFCPHFRCSFGIALRDAERTTKTKHRNEIVRFRENEIRRKAYFEGVLIFAIKAVIEMNRRVNRQPTNMIKTSSVKKPSAVSVEAIDPRARKQQTLGVRKRLTNGFPLCFVVDWCMTEQAKTKALMEADNMIISGAPYEI